MPALADAGDEEAGERKENIHTGPPIWQRDVVPQKHAQERNRTQAVEGREVGPILGPDVFNESSGVDAQRQFSDKRNARLQCKAWQVWSRSSVSDPAR